MLGACWSCSELTEAPLKYTEHFWTELAKISWSKIMRTLTNADASEKAWNGRWEYRKKYPFYNFCWRNPLLPSSFPSVGRLALGEIGCTWLGDHWASWPPPSSEMNASGCLRTRRYHLTSHHPMPHSPHRLLLLLHPTVASTFQLLPPFSSSTPGWPPSCIFKLPS